MLFVLVVVLVLVLVLVLVRDVVAADGWCLVFGFGL